jgi:hypothetical protein
MPVIGTLTVTVLDIIKRVLPRACRRAGLDRTIQWHVLRHTFASHLVMRGEPRKVVQELVGHANIESPIVTMWSLAISERANHEQSLTLSSGGGGNRSKVGTPGSDDSPTVSRTGIEQNTSKEREENALPDILMTMSQISDVNRELADVGAMLAVLSAFRQLARSVEQS